MPGPSPKSKPKRTGNGARPASQAEVAGGFNPNKPVYDFSEGRANYPAGANVVTGGGTGTGTLPQGPLGQSGTAVGRAGGAIGGALASAVRAQQPNVDTDYLANFQASLDSQRGSIDTQLAQALGSLRASGDNSAKVLATLPQALQQSYSGASTQLNNAQAAAQQALSPDNANATALSLAPLQAAISSNQAGNAASAPLLEQARLAQISAGENNLQSAAIEARARLAGEGRQLEMARFQADRDDRRYAQETAREERRYQSDRLYQDSQRDEERRYEQDVLNDRYEREAAAARDQRLADSGFDGTTQEYQSLKNSPAYRDAISLFYDPEGYARDQGLGDQFGNVTGNPSAYINHLRTTNPRLLQVLAIENPDIMAYLVPQV